MRNTTRNDCPKCGNMVDREIKYHIGSYDCSIARKPGPRCNVDDMAICDAEHIHIYCQCGYQWIEGVLNKDKHDVTHDLATEAENTGKDFKPNTGEQVTDRIVLNRVNQLWETYKTNCHGILMIQCDSMACFVDWLEQYVNDVDS